MPRQKPGRSIQQVGTPVEFLIAARRKIGIEHFTWDLAATKGVNECSPFGSYTKEDDALSLAPERWLFPGFCWLNPEFEAIGPWIERTYLVSLLGGSIAVLIPASIGSNWWNDWVHGKARVLILNGRITFVGHAINYPKDCCLLLYGPDQIPGYEPWSWMQDLTDEEREMAKKRIGKSPKSEAARAVKATKTPKVRQMSARKGATKTAKIDVATTPPAPARVTTFKPNGSTSMEVCPEPEPLNLREIQLPEPGDAVRVLRELAYLNDQGIRAKARYEFLKERTKDAKEKYDDLAEQVLNRLRQSTHKSDLPLFADVEKREADQAQMEAGPEAIPEPALEGPADEPSEATESEPLPERLVVLDGTDAPTKALVDDQIPF